jgi:peptidoglycan/xylan/chitin deacetylase (PgdA/CDA1 family)
MRGTLKAAFLQVSKSLGLFSLARFVTRRGLRILCYHGFALSDESDFRPKLFMRRETFEARMRYLSKQGYPVLSLQQACNALANGSLPDAAVAITIDDGFYSVLRCAVPILKERSFPTTVYVTSYYVQQQNPVFRLAVQYMFWKTSENELDTAGLKVPFSGVLPLRPDERKDKTMWEIISFAETHLEEHERSILAYELGTRLGIDYQAIQETRKLGLLSAQEIRDLATDGVDIQLHTHRHKLPEEQDLVDREISQNREFLEPLVSKKLQHLCYPSGIWSQQQWPWLDRLGIVSATTCAPGLNYAETPRLGLRRFLDGENISQTEFEAELSGFSEIFRWARGVPPAILGATLNFS